MTSPVSPAKEEGSCFLTEIPLSNREEDLEKASAVDSKAKYYARKFLNKSARGLNAVCLTGKVGMVTALCLTDRDWDFSERPLQVGVKTLQVASVALFVALHMASHCQQQGKMQAIEGLAQAQEPFSPEDMQKLNRDVMQVATDVSSMSKKIFASSTFISAAAFVAMLIDEFALGQGGESNYIKLASIGLLALGATAIWYNQRKHLKVSKKLTELSA